VVAEHREGVVWDRSRVGVADPGRAGIVQAQDRLETEVNAHTEDIRLWDCVEQTWSAHVMRDIAYQYYLRMVVNACSACSITGHSLAEIRKHLEMTLAAYHLHKDARVVRGEHGGECSACGTRNILPTRCSIHISGIIECGSRHLGEVKELLIHKYALGPSGPVIYRETVLQEGANGHLNLVEAGPEVDRVERTPRKRRRSRSRGKRGALR
jgi:hypothetical protein